MGWGGIQNVPADFDVFGGRRGETNIIEEALKGRVQGLNPAREAMFHDLKRNLLHRDYGRYFDGCLPCAAVLAELEEGRYLPDILRDIVQPALAVAVQEMVSVQKDAARSHSAKHPLPYDGMAALEHLYRKARPIALAYPAAIGAKEFDEKYLEVSTSVRTLVTL